MHVWAVTMHLPARKYWTFISRYNLLHVENTKFLFNINEKVSLFTSTWLGCLVSLLCS